MNKHWVLGLAALALLSACNRSTQLAVRAVSSVEGVEETGLPQQVIRLLPYDRDEIFSELAGMASEPEPQPPADLIELRDSVSVAQARWTESEAAWNDMRSEMQTLSARMENMDRSSNEYFQAYQRFDDLDGQVRRLDREVRGYFDAFTELQGTYRARADSFNAVFAAWADATFEDYGEIVDSLSEVLGEELVDTADASGWAYVGVPRGNWWIHTRSVLVFEELYWNVPYNSAGGADTVVLNASNAQVRPIF
ncbi:MAG: hypothetical protein AMS21_07175 [Gemmatimonas sp. SG8_38_2]|nr:MAG: hypothetical protein AMS21_07175 [Gemmatimonas sp. SG8_38_2]